MASDPITDAAREAACSFLETWEPGPTTTAYKLARAFANHAAAAVAEERALIVTWLRGQREAPLVHAHTCANAAAIERGVHLREESRAKETDHG